MQNPDIDIEDHESVGDPVFEARQTVLDARRAIERDQAAADADQSGSDADQTSSDADQTSSGTDQTTAERDQRASDKDQAAADLDRAGRTNLTPAEERAYDSSREQRASGSFERLVDRLKRAGTAHDRDLTSATRDQTATSRERATDERDGRAAYLTESMNGAEADLLQQLEELAARAAVDRARAAADRERARMERADAARERARLESELRSAHLDQLTGAYRREMGRMALSHEIDRARRSDGRFVLAFVDVDRLKLVNDRDGHAAGDRVLQAVVAPDPCEASLVRPDRALRRRRVRLRAHRDRPRGGGAPVRIDRGRDRGGDACRHQRRIRGSRGGRHGRSADRASRRGHARDQGPTPRLGPGRRQLPLSAATSASSWSGGSSPVSRSATVPSAPTATQYGNAVRP